MQHPLRVVRSVVAAAAFAVVISVGVPAVAATCTATPGETVVLRSSDFDPDVLVWDSRQRAIDYVAGNLKTASDVLNHTLLARPGTHAVVLACGAGSARPKYSATSEDVLGIKLTSGPSHGRYGWVTSDDLQATGSGASSP